MDFPTSDYQSFLTTIFSDETELFRSPAEPNAGDNLSIRLRLAKGAKASISLLMGTPVRVIPMLRVRTDECFDWYETLVTCGSDPLFYSFLIRWEGRVIHYRRTGPFLTDSVPFPDPAHAFRVIPGFHVPAWAKGALQYQIFPDRFYNGDPRTDVRAGEVFYAGDFVNHTRGWYACPGPEDYRTFYGGDLVGVMEKLDYLQSLGVEVLYLNPIFVSPSSHRYDTQDYEHVDPHLTAIPRDWDREDDGPGRYIRRTTDEANLKASDEYFAAFCQELHRRGMRIILDGVFNHCGSFHRWMDKERVYRGVRPDRPGAYDCPDSPYRSYFNFSGPRDYEAWWGVETLPKLNYEGSRELCEEIFHVAQKWASPPYSIDGWRLDVAADLGHSREFNHLFWKEFRRRVKAVNPEILIIAEQYGDPSAWLQGDEWDTVMNYDAFMEPLTFFLTGVDKHSDYRRDELWQNGPAFFENMAQTMVRLPTPSLMCAMNELSNHDHSRFLTRTNGRAGRLNSEGSAAAGEGIQPAVMREAVTVQMTWPGAPTIYYGDEAGLVGWTDPDNRRTYPWGYEDKTLIAMHRALAALRWDLPVLKHGSVQQLCAGHGYIAYARYDAEGNLAVVLVNNLDHAKTFALPLSIVGVPDGVVMRRVFTTTDQGYDDRIRVIGAVKHGVREYRAKAHTAAVLIPTK